MKANPQLKILSSVERPFEIPQSSYPLQYGKKRFLFDFSEAALQGRTCTTGALSTFGYARVLDINDDRHPREVARLINEVQDPRNCSLINTDATIQTQGLAQGDTFWSGLASVLFIYDMHYCRPDRQHDPTIMACAQFGSGLRVYDIRNPYKPREIAYYNTGVASASNPSLDFALAPPIVRRDLGQIWYLSIYHGLHVLQFEHGVWPFPGSSRCTQTYDYVADHYDPGYAKCPAALAVTRTSLSPPNTSPLARPHARSPHAGNLAATGMPHGIALAATFLMLTSALVWAMTRPENQP
jgi:hypothetical protein